MIICTYSLVRRCFLKEILGFIAIILFGMLISRLSTFVGLNLFGRNKAGKENRDDEIK